MRAIGFLVAGLLALAAGRADEVTGRFEEVRRYSAAEARQGVAVDADHFYAISNFALGKYRKDTGERVAAWEGREGAPLIHLNAGIVLGDRLVTAHSNYPGVPNVSSVEIFRTADLAHAGSHSFGRADGSLTWVERRQGRWLACFVHYGKKGGEPGRGPEWTRIVEYDDEWRETAGWVLPPALVEKIGVRGYSCSGGALGPGGYLYVTGHDDPALFVLRFPASGGPWLEWVGTIAIPTEGQAFGWDPADPSLVYLIGRKGREVIVGRVTLDPPAGGK